MASPLWSLVLAEYKCIIIMDGEIYADYQNLVLIMQM